MKSLLFRGRSTLFAGGLGVVALVLSSCAGRTESAGRGPGAYVVLFTATRTADRAPVASVSLPVNLGIETRKKVATNVPVENQPVMPEFLVRLNRTKQAGIYELVIRATAREAIRNKKGKLKLNKRYLGALVPTRLGETQVVSAESDPIHLEARLERR